MDVLSVVLSGKRSWIVNNRLVRQRRSARNQDGSTPVRIRVALRRELRIQILAHVDRAGKSVARKRPRKRERDRVAGFVIRALQFDLVAFDRAEYVPRGEI